MARHADWSDLQFFLAVCERGSVGAAAQLLGVNHSTVLRRIASLENSLSVRLFERRPGGYVPTSRGQELAAALAGLAEQVEGARRRVTGGDLQLAGSLRLTAPDTLLHTLLLQGLAAFRARHPALQLELVINNHFLNLGRREADVAVRGSNRPPENLVGRRVGRVQTALYASSAYLATLGPSADETDYRWVGHVESLAHLESARWIARHVPPDRVALRVDGLLSLARAVAEGFGVGWLLCPVAESLPGLVRLRPPPPEFDTQVWVLTHPDLRRNARVRALTDHLYQSLSADPRLRHDDRG